MTDEANMKITITPEQIESGEHLMFVGQKRMTDTENTVRRHEPILLSTPVCRMGKMYGLIIPLSLTPTDTAKMKLKFKPVTAKCYRACHIRSNDIQALVCVFEDGKQVMFDQKGARFTNFTTNGNGVDPEMVEDADNDLARALDTQPRNPACVAARRYLAENYLDNHTKKCLTMNLRLANVRDDSSLHSFDPSHRDNESPFKFQFVRPVVGVRKARLSVSKSCADRTGDLSSPACHCGSVISASGSGKPLNRECRALARATSASLTTRTPRATQPSGAGSKATNSRDLAACWIGRDSAKVNESPVRLSCFRESRYRAVSHDRTYRRK